MPNPHGKLPLWVLGSLAFGAVGVAVVVARSCEPAAPPSSTTAGAPSAQRRAPAGDPLPDRVRTLDHLLDQATSAARAWHDDAVLARLYATSVAADGGIDRTGSVAQVVFVSPRATHAQQLMNGLRWSLREGESRTEPISLRPAPSLPAVAATLCPLAPILGEDAPERVTVDVLYAPRAGSEPVLNAFTREPRRWVVTADPRTCQVRGRSRDRTDDEERWADASTLSAPSAPFDARGAADAVSRALDAASGCTTEGGPHGNGTVSVTFDTTGSVRSVTFLAGPFEGTETGRCLVRRIEAVHVAPWGQGDGRTAARFKL